MFWKRLLASPLLLLSLASSFFYMEIGEGRFVKFPRRGGKTAGNKTAQLKAWIGQKTQHRMCVALQQSQRDTAVITHGRGGGRGVTQLRVIPGTQNWAGKLRLRNIYVFVV